MFRTGKPQKTGHGLMPGRFFAYLAYLDNTHQWVMHDEDSKNQSLRRINPDRAGCRRNRGNCHKKRSGKLRTADKAGLNSAIRSISHCLVNPVCPDGDQCRTDLPVVECVEKYRLVHLFDSISRQFYMELPVLWAWAILSRIPMAYFAVGTHFYYDHSVLSDKTIRWDSSDPLPCLGNFCRVSESSDLVIK